jgi:hypothetical protein
MEPHRRAQQFTWKVKDLSDLECDGMLYYNMAMNDHIHHHDDHHHHHSGHAHPPASVHASILRLSISERLVLVSGVIAVLWAAAFWAMR